MDGSRVQQLGFKETTQHRFGSKTKHIHFLNSIMHVYALCWGIYNMRVCGILYICGVFLWFAPPTPEDEGDKHPRIPRNSRLHLSPSEPSEALAA